MSADGTTEGADRTAEEIVTDVFVPDGEYSDDRDVVAQPTARNHTVVDDADLSPEVAAAAAAEVDAAELSDAATAGADAEGGESAPDPA